MVPLITCPGGQQMPSRHGWPDGQHALPHNVWLPGHPVQKPLTQFWPAWQHTVPQTLLPGAQVVTGVQTPLVQVVFDPQQTVPQGVEP